MNSATTAAIETLRALPGTEPDLSFVMCLLLAECVEALDTLLNP